MKIEIVKNLGFTKTYPLGFEGEDDVCGWELEIGGLTFLCHSLDGKDCGVRENLDVVVFIYETDEQVRFTDGNDLETFINILKKNSK